MDLNKLTITQARHGLDNKEFSSVELTRACLDAIKKENKNINAVLTICESEALVEAKQADEIMALGKDISMLCGIPYLAKDNYLTKGVRTTAASKILENYIAPFDATVIKKLRAQKAVLLGKTNMDEFAHGSSTENSAFGVTKNPRDLNCVSGGSSGGSAAAVAADMCIFALGTDTGGSVRCPAAYCGTVGLKPTYGRASRFGVIAMTSSTDVPGPITKTVMDAATVLQAIAGHDQNDFTTTTHKIANYAQKLPNDINNLKIGVPKEFFAKGLDTEVEKNVRVAIDNLVKKGAQVLDVSLPHTKYAVTAYYIITPSEISSNLGRFDGVRYGTSEAATAKDLNDIYFKTRGKNFGAEVKRRIMIGTYALSAGYYDAYYLRAQKVRTKVIEEFDEVFKQVDVLVTPTMPTTAFKIGANKNPIDMYLEDVFTLSPSLAGLPAVSIPCGQVEKLPVGLQIIGKKFCEETVLNVAHHVA